MSDVLVAIIDDNASIRRALTRLLGTVGIRTRGFASGAEFLTDGLTLQPGCIVLEVVLRDMAGFALLEQLLARGQRIPTVLISADDEPSTRERARGLGAAFCRKPLDVPLFLHMVSNALHLPTPV